MVIQLLLHPLFQFGYDRAAVLLVIVESVSIRETLCVSVVFVDRVFSASVKNLRMFAIAF